MKVYYPKLAPLPVLTNKSTTMSPKQLTAFLTFMVNNRQPVLVTGKPGIGKSDIITQVANNTGCELILMHPSISDPTDFKGLPATVKGLAEFLPYGQLRKLINATVPTLAFIDDLGQSSPAVQAALMQLLLAREIDGKKVSDHVTFLAATNRKEDRAGVSGILEPVKSRFASIVELEVSTDDWCKWALSTGNMPVELVAFIRYRPELLSDFKPTRDLTNSPSPRSVAFVGKMLNAKLPTDLRYEAFKGAAGEGFAAEFSAFLEMYANLPNIDQIFLTPDAVDVPTDVSVLYATGAALSARINETNADNGFAFINRMPAEFAVATAKDMATRKPDMVRTAAFTKFSVLNGNEVFS